MIITGILKISDVAVALDLEDFSNLRQSLTAEGWKQAANLEQRWRGPANSFIDILPAGKSLLAAKAITWPETGMTMSLFGFDHVFQDSIQRELALGLRVKIIPPCILILLKIVACMEDRQRRFKDLIDIRNLLLKYEQDNDDRRFSDEVFAANLPDIEFAGAFLLGLDLAALCTQEEMDLVRAFVHAVSDPNSPSYLDYSRVANFATIQEERVRWHELETFEKGLLFHRA